MKTLKILAALCLLSVFGLESNKAQISSKDSCLTKNRITSLAPGNLSPGYGWLNATTLTFPVGKGSIWTDITKKGGFAFYVTGRNYFFILNSPALLNVTSSQMSPDLTTQEDYDITGTFNSKWERLTGKSLIDTSKIYYYPLSRTNEPTLYDNHLYRFAGNFFNMAMRYKYPRAYQPIKYPQSPYVPK